MCDDANEDYLKFFSKSAAKLRDKSIRSGIMDCKSKLPTGESAKKRFKLKRSVGDPMVIYAANSRKPRQVPKSELEGRSVKSFTDFIRKKTQVRARGACGFLECATTVQLQYEQRANIEMSLLC